MTTHPGFLAAIIAEPHEDVHRLVYADWLEEQGEADRAEFIRVQCELEAKRPRNPFVPEEMGRLEYLSKRERELIILLMKTENIPFAINDSYSGDGIYVTVPAESSTFAVRVYTRGFVSDITCTAANWLVHADTLTAAQPIERVTLTTWPEMHRSPQGTFKGDHRVTMFVSDKKYHAAYVPQPTPNEVACTILLNAEWPRITFTLPPEGLSLPLTFYEESFVGLPANPDAVMQAAAAEVDRLILEGNQAVRNPIGIFTMPKK